MKILLSPTLEGKGAVAQSVEQKTENLRVGGSIPSHTTNRPCKPIVYGVFYLAHFGSAQ